jgi:type 1 glutamine amidotransferase
MKLSKVFGILFILAIVAANRMPCRGWPLKKDQTIRVLLIDGQSQNHDQWKRWTPLLLKQLDDADLFAVDVCTTPPEGADMKAFHPRFKNYDLIVTTYAGDSWTEKIQKRFRKYVAKGGGLVVVHAANNAFPHWEAYNKMIGIGGGGGRNETNGPYVYYNANDELVLDNTPGKGGNSGEPQAFLVRIRNSEHPITRGIPARWLHQKDELYGLLRGPASDLEVLATAYSSEDMGGSGRHEPVLMTIRYRKGRIFHTTLGHSTAAMSCVGFMTTFVRGCEWAARGKVSFPVPADFPDEHTVKIRKY